MREVFARLAQPLAVRFLRGEKYTFNNGMRCEGWWVRTPLGNVRVLHEPHRLVLLVYPARNEDCIILRLRSCVEVERVRP
jgi:hypothetical protein